MAEPMTVENALRELREMFPDAAFVHAGGYAQWRKSEGALREMIVQIEGRGFRSVTLEDCLKQARDWKGQARV